MGVRKLEVVERRKDERFPAFKSAIIRVDGRAAVPCVIDNISESGALLLVSEPLALPATFALSSPGDGVTIRCRLSRVSGLTIAIEFMGP